MTKSRLLLLHTSFHCFVYYFGIGHKDRTQPENNKHRVVTKFLV